MAARKILIVEDESVVRLHLRRIVENMGHHVVGLASSAAQAIQLAGSEEPDLVLMDIHLQGEPDGVEAAKEIVRNHSSSIVFATAFADDDILRRTEEAGAVGYILKPFSERGVVATLSTALREHDRLVEIRRKEQTLAGIVGGLEDAVLRLDSELRLEFANPAARALVWTSEGELMGRNLQDVLHPGPEDDREILSRLIQSRARQVRLRLPVFSHLSREGVEVLLKGTIEPLDKQDGDCGYLVVLRHLSQRPETGGRFVRNQEHAGPRLLIYSHDTFGLGHLRRSLNLSASLVREIPDLSIILVTGSAMAHRFELPPRVDYVKLPAVRKVAAERYSSRSLGVSDDDVLTLRSNMLKRVIADFRPDILLADHSPAGMKGELRPSLEWVGSHLPECRTIIGLRDIIDDPEAVKSSWRDQGIFELLHEAYDHIVVYGDKGFFDPVQSYGFAPELAARTHFLGHVVEPEDLPAPPVVADSAPRILVTTGGGDGAVDEVAGGVLAAMAAGHLPDDLDVTILPGPLVAHEVLEPLKIRAAAVNARVLEFVESSSPYMAEADLVICTAGYNTATQVLRHARRALMIPRVMHRKEQLIRATRLAELGYVRFLHPDRLDPRTLGAAINNCLTAGDDSQTKARDEGVFRFGGADAFAAFCNNLLNESNEPTEAAHE